MRERKALMPYRAIKIVPHAKIVEEARIPRKDAAGDAIREIVKISDNYAYFELLSICIQGKQVSLYCNDSGRFFPDLPTFKIKLDRVGWHEFVGNVVLLGSPDSHGHNRDLSAAITCSNLEVKFN